MTKNIAFSGYPQLARPCPNVKQAGICQSSLTKEPQYVRQRALKFADAIQKQERGKAQEAWTELVWSHSVFLGDSKNPAGENFKSCLH